MLGFILVGEGYISRSDLYTGLREHEHAQEPLGQSLIKLGLLDVEHLTDALALQAHCARLASWEIMSLVKGSRSRRTELWTALEETAPVLVFGEHNGTLYIAMTDARAVPALESTDVAGGYDFAVFVVPEGDFAKCHAFLRGEEPAAEEKDSDLSSPTPSAPEVDEEPTVPEEEPTPEMSSIENQAIDQGVDSGVLDEAQTEVLGHNMLSIGYYEASEALFEAPDLETLGAVAASALRHFFTRVACLTHRGGACALLAKSSEGLLPDISLELPSDTKEPYYGAVSGYTAGEILSSWLGFEDSSTILVVCWELPEGNLVVVGAHEPQEEAYGDLNDVSGLFLEVETALNVLNNDPTNG